MADDVYTTLLNFVSDSGQAKRDIKGTTEELKKMEEQAKRVKFTPERTPAFGDRAISNAIKEEMQVIEKQANQMGIRISAGLKKAFRTGITTDADLEEARGIGLQLERIRELQEAKQQELRGTILAHQQKAILYRREASILNKVAADIRQNAQILENQAQRVQAIAQLGLGLGTAVAGGIFAFAAKYVANAEKATAVTASWKAAQDSLTKSGERTGAVFAEAALPLLQRAAQLAEKTAGFIERHPEIVQAALNTGLVVAGLSAVGVAVTKGIRLYTDQLYLSSIPLQLRAGELQLAAAHEQLLAARIKQGLPAEGIGTAGKVAGGGLLAGLSVPGAIIGGLAIGATISLAMRKMFNELGDHLIKLGGVAEVAGTGIKTVTNGLLSLISQTGGNVGLVGGGTRGGRFGSNDSTRFASAEIRERALSLYEDYQADDLQLVQDHYRDRQKIISDAVNAEARENQQYANNASKIRSQLSKSISQATQNFERDTIENERQNAQQRAEIIRDGGVDIQRIEEDLQERLRKLHLEHEDRMEAIVANRDALGLVKEQERFQQEKSEQLRETNIEVSRRRADLALRLQDLQVQYEQERAQRLEDYKNRVVEMRAQAEEQLRELAVRHAEEIAEIRRNKVDRIKELDQQFVEERKRRYNQFVAQLRDLDANLLGEKKLRDQRQKEMLADLDNFLQAYKSGLGTLTSARTPISRASGGYATFGQYLLGDNPTGGRGKPEYVMGGNLTELAERVLGGEITQKKLSAMFSMLGGHKNNVTYNDQRRIDGQVSSADRNRMVEESMQAFGKMLEGMA
jgi:hypothetical protein